jgi:hypothetical protein
MTDPEVRVDSELARLGEAKAAANGERLEDVIERMLREYVEGQRSRGRGGSTPPPDR